MRKFTLILPSFLMTITGLSAQVVSVGVVGGAPFTNVVTGTNPSGACSEGCSDNSGHYTVGPSVRVNLPSAFRLEADVLYRPYGFTAYGGDGFSFRVSGQQWSVPVLLEYRLGGKVLKPFVSTGVSFDHLSGISGLNSAGYALNPSRRSVAGIVIGGGVDLNLWLLHCSGELRYTRETQPFFDNASNLNQAEVLFGIRF